MMTTKCQFCGFKFETAALKDDHESYILASGLIEADSEEAECEGHESLRGDSMGMTVYCDGTCRVKKAEFVDEAQYRKDMKAARKG